MSPSATSIYHKYKYETTISNETVKHLVGEAEEIWSVTNCLGEGSYGRVFCQTRDNGGKTELRAVKSIIKPPNNHRSAKTIPRELTALTTLRKYPDMFVNFLGWYEDNVANTICIAMEYLPGGDLHQYIRNNDALARENCKEIITQILKALEIMHAEKLCHRDLKPQNVLLASKNPLRLKLADFGIAKSTNGTTSMVTKTGTQRYMAPEIQGINTYRRKGRGYTKAVDMWSLGAMAYEIVARSIPFGDDTPDDACAQAETEGSTVYHDALTSGGGDVGTVYHDAHTSSGGDVGTVYHNAQTDFGGELNVAYLVGYCEGRKEFPEAALTRSASETQIDFIKSLLAPNPAKRLSASNALKHKWITENSE